MSYGPVGHLPTGSYFRLSPDGTRLFRVRRQVEDYTEAEDVTKRTGDVRRIITGSVAVWPLSQEERTPGHGMACTCGGDQ